jgi:hypothetical protein
MNEVSWDEPARIYRRVHFEQGPSRERAVRMGDLNSLVQIAFAGQQGPLENIFIRTDKGVQFEAGDIAGLALRTDRPKLKQWK